METVDQLRARKELVDIARAEAKSALREMASEALRMHRYAPVKMYNELQMKITKLGQESQYLQHKLADALRINKLKNRSINDHFRDICRENLPDHLYSNLVNMAHVAKRNAEHANPD